jgi:DNA primase
MNEVFEAVEATAKLWEVHLFRNPAPRLRALDELASTGLDLDGEAVKAFRIGYAPPDVEGKYSYLGDRLIFPIINEDGDAVAFIGRALAPRPGDAIVPKYVFSPESAIFQKSRTLFGLWQAKEAIREQGHAVMVEANIDVIKSYDKGIRNMVAPLGKTFTVEQAKLLARFTKKVTLAYDDDGAGERASREAAKMCRAEGIVVSG